MKNLTPEHLRCPTGDCPAVYELDDGRLLIVGECVSDIAEVEATVRIGPNETAIVIDRTLLANVLAGALTLPPLDAIGFDSATFTAPPPGEPIDPTVSGPDVIGIT